MITPKIKDGVLEIIVIEYPEMYGTLNTKDIANRLSINEAVADAIIHQFEEKGFIVLKRLASGGFFQVRVTANAHDYFRNGGFVREEEVLMNELKKVQIEVESLYSSVMLTLN